MKKSILTLLFLLTAVLAAAQLDSIHINATFSENNKIISIKQEIKYHNRTSKPLEKIKLLNWIAAYKNRNTPLLQRLLEDRKNDLYFAKEEELGSAEYLKIRTDNSDFAEFSAADENIYLALSENLDPGKNVNIILEYELHLPAQKFTGYGYGEEESALKYFFIAPDRLESEAQKSRFYKNIEENQSAGNYWNVQFYVRNNWYVQSNLPQISAQYFEGVLNKDPEFLLALKKNDRITAQIEDELLTIEFGYELTKAEKRTLEFYLPLHLHFLKNKAGVLPKKIFITEKFREAEDFTGIDDLHFWKFNYQLFSDAEKTDLHYYSILSKAVVQNVLIYNKNKDHWLANGLKTYLEIEYLNRYYKERKLLGNLPENLNIFGLRPLHFFQLSKLLLSERYGLGYQYMLTQNLDQAITEQYENLSNFNTNAISNFETGSLFHFIAKKMGTENFDTFLQSYITAQRGEIASPHYFLDELSKASGFSSDFLESFIKTKNRVNFKLKRYLKDGEDFEVKVAKNTELQVPFQIETEEKNGTKKTFWFDTDTSRKPVLYKIPQSNADKIVINDHYIFPEQNFRDNYLYTKGLFANAKKIKFKVFKDIPNPEYNEIYLNPRLNFNAYDKILFGLNFKNSSLFEQKLQYSITPYFSSGTGKMAGSGGISYSFQPPQSFYRSLDLGLSASHFHYDYDLNYRKLTASAGINFIKNPRSDISRNLGFSYNYLEKDIDPQLTTTTEYSKYNLWNIGYTYADRSLIHEKSFRTNLQWMEDFEKISAEYFYRWEFSKDKKLSMRIFGGYFLSNNAQNDLFNYGIARVSNYAFSYGLLGQSATSGLFSQQLILAEGGFKSYLGSTVNQWITSVNVDTHVWRWFDVYADAGIYKNKSQNPEFIWDSGVKLKVIPDFLEVYFPIQSSLGFEPGFKDYGQRIRFTLVLNFSAITGYLRRGWF